MTCTQLLGRFPREPIDLAGIRAWAAVAYQGPAKDLVRALKYRSARAVAETMAAQIVACAPPALLAPGQVLVPVPLHSSRLRARGFNQAEVLASAIGRRTSLGVEACLVRTRATVSQVGRDREARLAALAGAIRARAQPARVVLVDDVFTTGATLTACAAALPSSRTVSALAYARTPGR